MNASLATIRPERAKDATAIGVVNADAFGGDAEARVVDALGNYEPEFNLVT